MVFHYPFYRNTCLYHFEYNKSNLIQNQYQTCRQHRETAKPHYVFPGYGVGILVFIPFWLEISQK